MASVTIDYRVRRRWLRWEAVVTTNHITVDGVEQGSYSKTRLGPSWRKDKVAQRARRWVATLAETYRAAGVDVQSACVWLTPIRDKES